MTKKPLVFLGTNSNLIQYVDICQLNQIPIHGVIDNDYFGNTASLDGVPVIGTEQSVCFQTMAKDFDFFVAANPVPENPRDVNKRKKFIALLEQHNIQCANIIDPGSRISSMASIGHGTFIGFGASISGHTTIGNYCQFHAQSIVAHHCRVGNNVTLQRKAMIGTGSTVGDNAFIGVNSLCHRLPGLTIGKNAVIHPGVTVMRDVQDTEYVHATGRKVYRTTVTDAIDQ